MNAIETCGMQAAEWSKPSEIMRVLKGAALVRSARGYGLEIALVRDDGSFEIGASQHIEGKAANVREAMREVDVLLRSLGWELPPTAIEDLIELALSMRGEGWTREDARREVLLAINWPTSEGCPVSREVYFAIRGLAAELGVNVAKA